MPMKVIFISANREDGGAMKELTLKDTLSACGHYMLTDALFLQGYNLLLEGNAQGKKVLEICCGEGNLTGWLGQVTKSEIVGIDISEQSIQTARKKYEHLTNVTFVCGDATDLSSRYEANSFNMIVGQAAMHHLAGNLAYVSKEYSRVLKQGGKLVFIFEPLGHNPLAAAIRAIHTSFAEYIDESNLFEWAIRDFAANFSRYEIYYFGLFAYFCKALPKNSTVAQWIYRKLNALDQRLFDNHPRLRKYAANFNVCYWK
jgi:ubiquinone/menaquinone biosynthesis C-methylase UbiE